MCVCARLCVSEIVWGVRVRVYMFCLVAACVRVSCFLFFMYTGAGACVSGAGCVSRPVVLPYFFRRTPLPRAAGPPGAHSSHSPAHSRPHTRTCADVCMRMWGMGLLASGVAPAGIFVLSPYSAQVLHGEGGGDMGTRSSAVRPATNAC